MLEAVMYPVSGIMKLWHILLHSVFGLDESLAWFYSIFCLIATVRLIILPFFWKQMKNTRVAHNLRPQLASLRKQYALVTDPEKRKERFTIQKQLYKDANYSSAAGCVPSLIQLPVFIGLYRVMLNIARPTDGLESQQHHPIGLLSSDDVSGFVATRVNDVPIAAHLAMKEEQFALLHTNFATVHSFMLPLVICASVFTGINMCSALFRMYHTADFNNKLQIRIQKTVIPMMLIGVLFPCVMGLHGPFPVAIAMYWFGNNLWTLTQTNIIMLILHIKHPLSDEFRRYRADTLAQRRAVKRLKRLRRWGLLWRRSVRLITFGSLRAQLGAEIADIVERARAHDREIAEKKARAKEAKRQLKLAQKQKKELEKQKKELAAAPAPTAPAPASQTQAAEAQAPEAQAAPVQADPTPTAPAPASQD